MFIQRCFIRKNTKDLRDALECIGYQNYAEDDRCIDESVEDVERAECLYVNVYTEEDFAHDDAVVEETPYYDGCSNEEIDKNLTDYGIDCICNDAMFKALAALKDDSNERQWYTDGSLWVRNGFTDLGVTYTVKMEATFHKATVDE